MAAGGGVKGEATGAMAGRGGSYLTVWSAIQPASHCS